MNLTKDHWSSEDYRSFTQYLAECQDEKYRQFHSSLVPGKENIIGIRMPQLRKMGKEIAKGNWKEFLHEVQEDTYEEVMVEGIVIGQAKVDYEEFCSLVDQFTEKVDNWGVCDCFCGGLTMLKKYKKEFWEHLENYLKSDSPWKQRVALVIMLGSYMEEDYIDGVLERCDSLSSEQYYVRMAQSWLVSVAYVKFPEITQRYLEHSNLDNWTYNKAIQKIRESYRVDAQTKEKLKQMKR